MILFVNACIRGDESRTYQLCREYLAEAKKVDPTVREVNLNQMGLDYFNAQKVAFRSQLTRKGCFDDDIYRLAHQLAEADDVVIGAPYWDLSFPAALKTYIEHVSVDGITFRFTEQGTYEGLCKTNRVTYITTSGGFTTCEPFGVPAAHPRPGMNLGYDYVRAIADMFGMGEVRYVAAEGLDVAGIDIEERLDQARARIAQLVAQE